jgi:hypothetical protein
LNSVLIGLLLVGAELFPSVEEEFTISRRSIFVPEQDSRISRDILAFSQRSTVPALLSFPHRKSLDPNDRAPARSQEQKR